MSAAGKRHMARVAALGCVVCRNEGLGVTPASAHHINCATMGRKADDFETIPLCPVHHQDGDGTERFKGHIAAHKGLESFEARYGTEQEFLEQTLRDLGVNRKAVSRYAIRRGFEVTA